MGEKKIPVHARDFAKSYIQLLRGWLSPLKL